MVEVGHSELLRKDALRGLAVVAFAQHREQVGTGLKARADLLGKRCDSFAVAELYAPIQL